MAFCNQCGTKLEEGAAFCAQCGTKTGTIAATAPVNPQPVAPQPVAPQQPQQPQQPIAPQQPQQDFVGQAAQSVGNVISAGTSAVSSFLDTPDTTSDFDVNDINANKLMGIFAYLGCLILVPIFAARKSKFACYHVGQGALVALMGLTLSTICLLGGIIAPVIGIVLGILQLPIIALMVLGIINVANGKAKELPLIGKFGLFK